MKARPYNPEEFEGLDAQPFPDGSKPLLAYTTLEGLPVTVIADADGVDVLSAITVDWHLTTDLANWVFDDLPEKLTMGLLTFLGFKKVL